MLGREGTTRRARAASIHPVLACPSQVPQFLLDDCWARGEPCRLMCTQVGRGVEAQWHRAP